MVRAFLALLFAALGPCPLSHAHTFLTARRHDEDAGAQQEGSTTQKPVPLDSAAMRRGVEEVAIAKIASKQALVSAKDAWTVRQNLIADQAVADAKATYLKVRPMLPSVKAQLLTVRKYTAEAWLHMQHARKVQDASKHIADDAAAKAIEITKGWIEADAHKSAESASKVDNRADRLAAAVAGAAEPYHLALLRNQKFCAETYAKAKSAQQNSVKLITDAKKIALKAQEMQAAGIYIEARQTWGTASGMINSAEELRQWGNKLYGQANTACGEAGKYELLEQQAAASTAATMIMNAPMKLPPK